VSEFTVLGAAMDQHRYSVAGAMLLFLLVAFLGMGGTVLGVVQGEVSSAGRETKVREDPLTIIPIVVLLVASVVMGIALPPAIRNLVWEAAEFVGAKR
jgi:formate hydrogenlyase subunit 3/multisubunit Na+/H+ antiporter MnhD subunit